MKIRQGFVSNSSSASFVIYWLPSNPIRMNNIGGITKPFIYNEITKIVGQDLTEQEIQQLVDGTNMTQGNNAFRTMSFTIMYNSIEDFGNPINTLRRRLEDTGQLIDTTIYD